MKKVIKKSFTLVELLAVITILAILAIVVAPIVSSTMKKTKIQTASKSLEMYADAVSLAYSNYRLTHGEKPESFDDIKNTIDFINNHNIQGIKIHSTYVVENTKLADMYKNNVYTPISLDFYLDSLVYIITHINPNIVIHRISGDAPKDILLAPEWNTHKKYVLNGLDKLLIEKNLWQGKFTNY